MASTSTKSASDSPRGIDLPQEFNCTLQIILIHQPASAVAGKLSKRTANQEPVAVKSLGEAFRALKPIGGEHSGFYEPAIMLCQLKGQSWTIWYGSDLYGETLTDLAEQMQCEVVAYGYEDTSCCTYLFRFAGGKLLGSIEDCDTFEVRGDPTDGDQTLAAELETLTAAATKLHESPGAEAGEYRRIGDMRDRLFSRIVASVGAYLPRFVYVEDRTPGARPNPVPDTPNGNADIAEAYVIRRGK